MHDGGTGRFARKIPRVGHDGNDDDVLLNVLNDALGLGRRLIRTVRLDTFPTKVRTALRTFTGHVVTPSVFCDERVTDRTRFRTRFQCLDRKLFPKDGLPSFVTVPLVCLDGTAKVLGTSNAPFLVTCMAVKQVVLLWPLERTTEGATVSGAFLDDVGDAFGQESREFVGIGSKCLFVD